MIRVLQTVIIIIIVTTTVDQCSIVHVNVYDNDTFRVVTLSLSP